MRLPPSTSSSATFVRYGLYVVRRLRRAKLDALAKDVEKATLEARAAGRAWEDANDAIQAAYADRDGADDDLDETAQEVRVKLFGRAVGADRAEPYTLIFPDGIGYYVAAPIDENAARYGELSRRLEAHLAASDPLRKSATASLRTGIKELQEAEKSLEGAESEERLAATRTRKALRSFERQIEKTYGALVTEHGRAKAERFFPKVRAARALAAPPAPPSE
jgi:hypothetical protein